MLRWGGGVSFLAKNRKTGTHYSRFHCSNLLWDNEMNAAFLITARVRNFRTKAFIANSGIEPMSFHCTIRRSRLMRPHSQP